MTKIINGNSLDLGVCYYPEHWNSSIWENDIDRMLGSGIKTVRIAEFAWSLIEKTEGHYDYSLFDSFLDLCEKKGMQVIFCTPTATPPAWLTEAYPEVLNCDVNGTLYRHGMRRHYNYNSPIYRKYCREITLHFAEHYGKRSCIIGWQLDNELNCETAEFHSEADSIAFRDWLKEKYGTLDNLNQAWGTVVWSQTYTAWTEIHVPRKTIHDTYNPHLHLDFFRFISDSAKSFAKEQADIIRKHCKKDDFITTNGIFSNLDNHQFRRESLDFFTYDSYPDFAFCIDMYRKDDPLKDRNATWRLAETRAVSPVFGIMEQQSGACGWTTRMEAPTPRPGQVTLWTMQSIAHGADYVSWFRWRTATVGTEIYWHGILDYSGRDNRRLKEIQGISSKVQKIQCVAGSVYKAKVGLIRDYDNIFDTQCDAWHKRVDNESNGSIFEACHLSHTPLDFVYFESEPDSKKLLEKLSSYQVLFYPHPTILTKERMDVLEKYVENGGKLVFGCRTGYKDMNGRCVMDKLPGLAAKLSGCDIPEYTLAPPDDIPVNVIWDGEEFEAAVFNDMLVPEGNAEVLAKYTNSQYTGEAALIRNRSGKGECYYFGGAFSRKAAEIFLRKLGVSESFSEYAELPDTCEIAVREKAGKKYIFILNYAKTEQQIELKKEMLSLFDGSKCSGKITLPPYGTMVFEA